MQIKIPTKIANPSGLGKCKRNIQPVVAILLHHPVFRFQLVRLKPAAILH